MRKCKFYVDVDAVKVVRKCKKPYLGPGSKYIGPFSESMAKRKATRWKKVLRSLR